MDIITYALCKRIASAAVSGISRMSVEGQILSIETKDGNTLTMEFPTPKDGNSIETIDISGSGDERTITFYMSDHTTQTAIIPVIKGDKGDVGDIGPKGDKGDTGDSAYEIAVSNGFNGTEQEWLASLRGEQGIQGVPGNDGADGSDGVDGDDGASAYEVALEDGFVGTRTEWLRSLKGEKGDTGEDGKSFTIKAQYDSYQALIEAHPVGNAGDAYFVGEDVNPDLYVWLVDDEEWYNAGQIAGIKGDTGEDGVSISTVVQTTTSEEDGGTNIITVTLSNDEDFTFSVKNGNKGTDGETIEDITSEELAQMWLN